MWGQTGRWGTRAHSLQPTQEEERAVSFRGDGVKEGVEEERVRACMGVGERCNVGGCKERWKVLVVGAKGQNNSSPRLPLWSPTRVLIRRIGA